MRAQVLDDCNFFDRFNLPLWILLVKFELLEPQEGAERHMRSCYLSNMATALFAMVTPVEQSCKTGDSKYNHDDSNG